jgi:diguanylate cyclase (GGDEF)-like protein
MNVDLARQRKELQKANTALSELAITDGLTGLKNHRHFREILEEAFACSARENTLCSVILLDVDRFKQYNDTYGHPAGDDVLRIVSKILQQNARSYDVVARYGGEEFVILCRSARKETAMRVAERLRKVMEKYSWPRIPVTASFGVSTYSLRSASASDLVSEADKALYRSKEDGRNRVTHYDSMLSASDKSSDSATTV